MKIQITTIITSLLFAIPFAGVAQAHELGTEISKPTRFERMADILTQGCQHNRTTLDCSVTVLKSHLDLSNKAKMSKNIRDAIATSPYVESIDAHKLNKNNRKQIEAAFETVYVAGGIEFSTVSDTVLEAIDNDVFDESSVEIVAGHMTGSFSLDHSFVAFVDTQNNEIIFFQGGYTE